MLLDGGCRHPPVGESVDRLRIKTKFSGRECNLIYETALDIGAEGRTRNPQNGHRLFGPDQGSMVLRLFGEGQGYELSLNSRLGFRSRRVMHFQDRI